MPLLLLPSDDSSHFESGRSLGCHFSLPLRFQNSKKKADTMQVAIILEERGDHGYICGLVRQSLEHEGPIKLEEEAGKRREAKRSGDNWH